MLAAFIQALEPSKNGVELPLDAFYTGVDKELVIVGEQSGRLLGAHGEGLAKGVEDGLEGTLRVVQRPVCTHSKDVHSILDHLFLLSGAFAAFVLRVCLRAGKVVQVNFVLGQSAAEAVYASKKLPDCRRVASNG